MRKLFLIAGLMLLSFAVFAQDSLKGVWVTSESQMGVTVAGCLKFDDDLKGASEVRLMISLDVDMLGTVMSGELVLSQKGSFERQGEKMTINWDRSSCTTKYTKPIYVSVKGESSEEMKKYAKEMIDGALESARTEIPASVTFDKVIVKKDKLTLVKTEDGKVSRDTYRRFK